MRYENKRHDKQDLIDSRRGMYVIRDCKMMELLSAETSLHTDITRLKTRENFINFKYILVLEVG